MNALVLLCGVLVAAGAEAAKPSEADLKAYENAKAQAKRDPAAHVRLALWCEAHGLEAQRLKHLAIALLSDPQNATARGLMGLVSFHGQWRKPADVVEKVQADATLAATLADYNAKRAKASDTADAQWRLALWCEEKGLKAEAIAHLSAVVRLDPSREAAWKRLGGKKHNGRWMNKAQIAVEKAEIDAQKKADHHWKPLLEKWRDWLGLRDRREEAESLLLGVTDPRAIQAIGAVFGAGDGGQQTRAVQLLGQIDAPGASRALAGLAMFGSTVEVRRKATETLRQRDAREFAYLLINLLRETIQFEVRPVKGPGAPGELFIKGKLVNHKRLYDPAQSDKSYTRLMSGDVITFDSQGSPIIYRERLYEVYMRPAAPAFDAPQMPMAFAPTFTNGYVVPQPGLSPVFLGPRNRPIAPPAGPAASLLANYWQPTSAGFGSWDYGSSSYSLVNFVLLPTILPRPSSLGVQRITLSSGVGGIPNVYFVFRQATQINLNDALNGGTAAAQKQLQADVKSIEDYNDSIRDLNSQSASILENVSGVDLGKDREPWNKWWVDQIGYAYIPQKYKDNPTIQQDVPIATFTTTTPVGYFQRISCFGAGTLVRTIAGNRPIETLAVGDQVLTQDTRTGALSYQPILVVHHNPPSKTFRITLDHEPVISSEFHRFWKAGRGWVMARDLKVGDTIRTLDGLARVTEFETDKVQPVFNLDIAETGSFFVGQQGALVHDNTLPAPVLQPFDTQPDLAAAAVHY